MIIIIFGAPGSGKGTQSKFISDSLSIKHLSTGDILREAVANKTVLGNYAAKFMNDGDLVPDKVIIDMIKERIKESDCSSGFILDGFPRTAQQAVALDEMFARENLTLDHVIYLEIDDQFLVERITGRRINPNNNKEYHIKFNPPKIEGKCDVDGSDLIQRPDDTEEKVRVRLNVFKNQTFPVLDFYSEKKLVRKIQASKPISDVKKDILDLFN